jgi:hypothetical protein
VVQQGAHVFQRRFDLAEIAQEAGSCLGFAFRVTST